MKRIALCLLLSACGSDLSPGTNALGRAKDSGLPGDGDDSERDHNADDGGEIRADELDDVSKVSDGGADGGKPGKHDAGPSDGETHCYFKACPPDAISVNRTGTTPWGMFLIQRAGVVYTVGFTQSTSILLSGTIDGDHAELMVTAGNGLNVDPVVLPGTYSSSGSEVSVFATLYRETSVGADCEQSQLGGVQLVIQKHVASKGTFQRGEEVELSGKVKIAGSGWNLDAAFDITSICDRFTDI